MMTDTYIVICLADASLGLQTPPMVLATRRVFATRDEAEKYAATIHYMRYPGVVAGEFTNLRDPDLVRCLRCQEVTEWDFAAGTGCPLCGHSEGMTVEGGEHAPRSL